MYGRKGPIFGQNRVNFGGLGFSEFFFILIFLFILLESPLKNSGPYDKSSWDIFEIRPFSGKNRVIRGIGGVPDFIF